jgi:HEAT repeat protein
MNALSSMNSKSAVNEYISWSQSADEGIKSAAYNALARSASPQAYDVLSVAAQKVSFGWDRTGASAALLNYAIAAGQNGDLKTTDKICKLIMDKAGNESNLQSRIAALDIYTKFHGKEAFPLILKAAASDNKEYRTAAMRMTLDLPGNDITESWIKFFPKAKNEAKAELISMLGERRDKSAAGLVTSALSNSDPVVRAEAASAIVKISGPESLQALTGYLKNGKTESDQQAAGSALMTVITADKISSLRPLLQDGSAGTQKTVIGLMGWSRNNQYFNDVLPFTGSKDETVKAAAFGALPGLAGPSDINTLLSLISSAVNQAYTTNVQNALINAALQIPDPEMRSDAIIKAMANGLKDKLIPVLAKTGGKEALKTVLNEFENGTPEMRDIVFKTLTSWKDYSASSALYEICASGNKTYEAPAFEGYIRQIRSTELPDDQKLLLFRKIMPYATSAERKNQLLNEIGKIKTYPALFFVAGYINDAETSAAASRAAMTIALPSEGSSKGMTGNIVKEILSSSIEGIRGGEADYDKENIRKYISSMPQEEGFVKMFNGKDLSGWHGLVDPKQKAKLKPSELPKAQSEADKKVPENWSVRDGLIWFTGNGNNLCSIKDYGDFEMLVDWKISKKGDSGIYLRGTPQVQIWDPYTTVSGASVGSGGLYNNKNNPSKPLVVADNPIGDWNTFRILMIGDKVTVWLNGMLVVDNVTLENYWFPGTPIFPKGSLELQAHGTDLAFRDIWVREIKDREYNLTEQEKADGYEALFNGRNLDNWVGNKESYIAQDGMIVVKPSKGSGGNLYTASEYSDFIVRFEFQLTPGANNGLGIRAPLSGDAAYVGMELQILDNEAPVYANLQPYQYHGSVYGVIPAKRGFLKPVGEWNYEEVEVRGTHVRVTLNGTVITDGDIAGPRDNGTMDHKDHPGLKNPTGHIGFLGHGSELKFRNLRIKDLSK